MSTKTAWVIHIGQEAPWSHIARCGAGSEQAESHGYFSIVTDPEVATCLVCKEKPRHLCIGDSASTMRLACGADIKDASWDRGPTVVTCFDCLMQSREGSEGSSLK